jgi:hypothetical protein
MEHLLKIKCVIFKGECALFSFNKCPIYTHDGAKCSTITLVKRKTVCIWGTDTSKGHVRAEVWLVPLEAEHAGKIKEKVTLSVLFLNFYFFVIFNNY